MPYNLIPPTICLKCPYGVCVEYLGDKKFKDRATKYRLKQNTVAWCVFDKWLPGIWADEADRHAATSQTDWPDLLNQIFINGRQAGHTRTEAGLLTVDGKPFFLTEQQVGKVRGDVFQLLVGASLWNACIVHNEARAAGQPMYAVLTLGDNYDLTNLLTEEYSAKLNKLQRQLAVSDTQLAYSTPDFVVIDISNLSAAVQAHFSTPISSLHPDNQVKLVSSRKILEGYVGGDTILAAIGLKTSIRSDRMYQLLFEANAWKFVWRAGFTMPASRYYAIFMGGYGADAGKLTSVDFSSIEAETGLAQRAIDGVFSTSRPADLAATFAHILAGTLPTVPKPPPPPPPKPPTLF